jgi:hypothetical protein
MTHFFSNRKVIWPWLSIFAILLLAILLLYLQGRLWICSCGQIYLWVSDVWSADNSQHISDPYSFSHLLHGVIFFWVLAWTFPRLPTLWQLSLATLMEATWEVLENAPLSSDRYREATAALGYTGATIVNSVGDILFCLLGVGIARQIGFRWSVVLFVATELVLLFWIRDNLTLNVLMLIYPIEAIRVWQIGP